jgi:hypothetical protein
MTRALGILTLAAATVVLAACDSRINPITGVSGRPPAPAITVPTGDFDLRAVDDAALPHATKDGVPNGLTYSLVSATFQLHADSTWIYSSVEAITVTNTGNPFGNPSVANYQGKWSVKSDTIKLSSPYGWIRMKGDTLFWRGGPRHTWEDTLKFTLVKK